MLGRHFNLVYIFYVDVLELAGVDRHPHRKYSVLLPKPPGQRRILVWWQSLSVGVATRNHLS